MAAEAQSLEAPLPVGEVSSSAEAADAYVVCRAETAECTCPDSCQRDHDNE